MAKRLHGTAQQQKLPKYTPPPAKKRGNLPTRLCGSRAALTRHSDIKDQGFLIHGKESLENKKAGGYSKHIENAIKVKLDIPEKINKILSKKKQYIDIKDYDDFKKKILSKD